MGALGGGDRGGLQALLAAQLLGEARAGGPTRSSPSCLWE